MSSDITKTEGFKYINELDTDKINLAKSPKAQTNQETVSKVAQRVISSLQSSNQEINIEKIADFISKIDKINDQFENARLGSPFATSIAALKILLKLRQDLPEDIRGLAAHPFIIKLSQFTNQKEIKEKEKQQIGIELCEFLESTLIPAVRAVKSPAELYALAQIIEDCSDLTQRVRCEGNEKRLTKNNKEMLDYVNLKGLQQMSSYKRMIKYEEGDISYLADEKERDILIKRLSKMLDEFYALVELQHIPADEQRAMYNGFLALEKDLKKYGSGKELDGILKTMRTKFHFSDTSSDKPETASLLTKQGVKGKQAELASTKTEESGTHAPLVRIGTTTDVTNQKLIKNIQIKISRLDLGSPNFKESIKELIKDVQKLKPLLDASFDISSLEITLKLFIDTKPFAISAEEQKLIELLGKKHHLSRQELAEYSLLGQFTIKSSQSDLIKELKKNANDFKRLNYACKGLKERLQKQVLQQRFKLFSDKNSLQSISTPKFVENFANLVETFQIFTTYQVKEKLESKFNEILAIYTKNRSDQFSNLLSKYNYLDPRLHPESFIEACQIYFFNLLDFSKIGQMTTKEFLAYLSENVQLASQIPEQYFSSNYKKMYQHKHQWLYRNMKSIIRSYNQGQEDSTNLGAGVCYNNSLFRWGQIAKISKISSKDILLGSNDITRYRQNMDKRFYEAYEKNQIQDSELYKKREEIYGSYGLKANPTELIQAPSGKDLYQFLVERMGAHCQAGETQILLTLRKSALGIGHAVNIQFDKNNNVYRLIDDNIGIIEFKNLKNLQDELAKYFKLFYPEYTYFEFETFQLSKKN
jgi:hypothetical protein